MTTQPPTGTTTIDLETIAAKFFECSQAGDADTLATLFAPGAILMRNNQPDQDATAAIEQIRVLAQLGAKMRYENQRRIVTESAVVEEHDVRLTAPDGTEAVGKVCVIMRFNDDGKCVSASEYQDPAVFAPILRALGA